jgi:hypothetical protein
VRRVQTLAPPLDVVGRPSSPSPLITHTWSLLSLRPNGRAGGASASRRRATTLKPCQRIRPLALWSGYQLVGSPRPPRPGLFTAHRCTTSVPSRPSCSRISPLFASLQTAVATSTDAPLPNCPAFHTRKRRAVGNKGQTPRPVVGHSSWGRHGLCACPSNAPTHCRR